MLIRSGKTEKLVINHFTDLSKVVFILPFVPTEVLGVKEKWLYALDGGNETEINRSLKNAPHAGGYACN